MKIASEQKPHTEELPEVLNTDGEGWIVSKERSISFFRPWNNQKQLAAELVKRYNAHAELLEACQAIVACSKYWANAFSGERRALQLGRKGVGIL